MATQEFYKKQYAQSTLAEHGVRELLEQLTSDVVLSQPSDPVATMLAHLHAMESGEENRYTEAQEALRQRRVITIVGPPLSGKTTQCWTAKHVTVLSPEQLMEQALRGGRAASGESVPIPVELQTQVQQAAAAGVAPSTRTIVALLHDKMTRVEAEAAEKKESGDSDNEAAARRFLIDGFPCTIEDALQLEEAFGAVSSAICVDCPAALVKERMTAAGLSPDAQAQRWARYEREMRLVQEYWRAQGKLAVVDGSAPRQSCGEALAQLLEV